MWQGVMVDITERKRAEEQLRATEERYRALVEKIPAIVYAEPMREAPGLLYLSPQVESILGYSAEEWAEGIDFWWRHIHPDDLDAVREINTLANETHETFHTEYRFRHRDGRWIWIHDEATVVHDDAGSALFWQGMLVDITSQKQAEQDLREAERRHRTLIEHIPAVVYRESPDAAPEKFYISPQVTDLFGYTADEWTWTTDFWKDRVHPDDQAVVFEVDERSNHTLRALPDGLSAPASRRPLGVGPRRSDVRPRGRRRRVLAGLPARHHRAQAGGGRRPRRRTEVPHDRGTEPSDLLHPGDRPRRPGDLTDHLHRPRQHEDDRLLAAGRAGRPHAVAQDHPPRRPRPGVRRRRRQQHRRRRYLLHGVPDDRQGRAHRLGPGRGPLDHAAGQGPRTGRASCWTSPSARNRRPSWNAPSTSSGKRPNVCARWTT